MTRGRWMLVALAAAAVALGAWWWFGRGDDPAERYRLAAVTRGDLVEQVSANGTINPVRVINVGTQVSGTVARLNVDFNDRVTAGQVLLTLDPRVYEARLAASEAQLANLRAGAALQAANARRAAELRRQEFISQQDFETARAGAASAEAQVRAAAAQIVQDRTNLGYTVIRSPVAGVVISRQVDIGQTVAASFQTPTLFTIARDLSQMQIEAQIAEADVARVRVGQVVRFLVDAYPDRAFEGRVTQLRLNPQTVQNVVTYAAIVAVPNPDGALLPGMTASAEFVVREFADVTLVPNAALSWKPEDWKARRGGRDAVTVFVLGAAGTPEARRVRLGAADADASVVLAGKLRPGERVITGEVTGDGGTGTAREKETRRGGRPPAP